MLTNSSFKNSLPELTPESWQAHALALFRYQAEHNPVYRQYIYLRGIDPDQITELTQIPFLPIEFFKTHRISTGNFEAKVVYQSSGTTQTTRSRHYLPDDIFYKENAQRLFEYYYGPLTDYIFLPLLPSYLEQGDSSLVAMVDYFIKNSGQGVPGFYLNDFTALLRQIEQARQTGKKVLLIGVTYALLDLAEAVKPGSLVDVIIMETGGMKGRRREMVRAELHEVLQQAFGVKAIHSEYGMTELLSQAYSLGEGIFKPAPTLKIFLRDMNDPLTISNQLKSGGINVIDLANVDSCAFLETKDIGKLHPGGSFEVLGRFDNSDIRGCNLMIG
ncbi:acyltransferase [Adhaeribacter aerolatus]|uniref:Acyltransferase n=1 Tax=Adhaeribacter aerolatus TaxID=670289 RepID=A0A512AY90_9BACT|nr:acyl transferase [Adhaeribacter aerolatus]GEO04692.1 acyltransferase [Adhaeribacter aerolatus]